MRCRLSFPLSVCVSGAKTFPSGRVNFESLAVKTLNFHWPAEHVFVTRVDRQLQATVFVLLVF